MPAVKGKGKGKGKAKGKRTRKESNMDEIDEEDVSKKILIKFKKLFDSIFFYLLY